MKNIRKKKKKKNSKMKNTSGQMAQGKPQLKFEEIYAITSEIIDATDGRPNDGRISIS